MNKTVTTTKKMEKAKPAPGGMEVVARLRYLRMSPRKTRLIANFLTGMDVQEANEQLKFLLKAAKEPVVKLLQSAVANATHNFQLDKNNLYIKKFIVNQGPTLKRFKPKAYGRAGEIRRRTAHLELTLGEKVPSKRVAKKATAAAPAEVKTVGLDEAKASGASDKAQAQTSNAKAGTSKGFTKKLFNRKTG